MALTHSPRGELGFKMPSFKLLSTQEEWITDDFAKTAKGSLVVFMCNHCPYVQAIEDRLITLGNDLHKLNLSMVGISSNDVQLSPDDSFEKMQKRAREKNYSFPYLYDETQEVAKNFGAVCTPDFFLFDAEKTLVYRGRLDDSWKNPDQVSQRELYQCALALSQGRPLPKDHKSSMGCSIKWREHK